MGVIHTYADNSHGVGHQSSMGCACNPTRKAKNVPQSRGSRGRHQGYRVEYVVQHNVIS